MDFVRTAWPSNCGNLTTTINSFCDALKLWNQRVFGNIHKRKRHVLARIKGIQLKLADRHIPFLVNLEKDLMHEFQAILKQEEELWRLKSRVDWMTEGDCNTKFFHTTTLIRRNKNRISGLKIDSQ